ncbi:MAG: AAA family ATPase [Methanosphaera sp.]|nr:AAA family ATPase [Methanosphaera sp.]
MLDYIDYDRESPFEPGKPAPPDLFIGRRNTITKILRNIPKVKKGNTQHFFLTGKRRMGKTSVTEYIKRYVKNNYDIFGAYVSNKGNNSVETLTSMIIESIFNEMPQDSLAKKVNKCFGDHVESIEVKGNKINIKADDLLEKSFKDKFPEHLSEIYERELSEEYDGLLIIIDDINGLSESKEFVDWYKKFADTIAVNYDNLPLYFLLAGYPEKFENMVQQEESFGSIFHYDYIDALTDEEVSSFFESTFNQEGYEIKKEALNYMVQYSSGLPLLMQQIGDSIFWECETTFIDENIAINGIFKAADEIGNKQIKPVLSQIQSENYEPLLEKLVELELSSFKRSELIKIMKNTSENVIKNFLYKMVDLGIFEQVGHKNSGLYKFSNTLYYMYFLIKKFKKDQMR